MKIVLLVLYAIAVVVHLYFCFIEKESARKITKLFLMPLLLVIYCTMTHNILPGIIIALCAGFLGDYFLLKIEVTSYFMLGLGFFFIGHISYIISILQYVEWNILRATAILVVAVLLLTFLYLYLIRKMPKKLQTPGLFYLAVLLCLLGSSCLALWQQITLESILLGIGALSFCISDFLLAESTFLKKIKKENFYIMLTYITAQTLIVTSFMLL